jgi:hypothetical protein
MYLKFSMDPYPNSVHEDHLKHKAPKINVQNSTVCKSIEVHGTMLLPLALTHLLNYCSYFPSQIALACICTSLVISDLPNPNEHRRNLNQIRFLPLGSPSGPRKPGEGNENQNFRTQPVLVVLQACDSRGASRELPYLCCALSMLTCLPLNRIIL